VCGPAAKDYIKGWVEAMHSLGGQGSAGVYGNQDVASQDFKDADEGYITRADKHVTVWGLNHYSGSGLTDDLAWTRKNRIHQYRIKTPSDPAHETWGGAEPYEIDQVQHCLLIKPPYDSPTSFDFIGNIRCDWNSVEGQAAVFAGGGVLGGGGNEQTDWLGINGLGQIVGSPMFATSRGYKDSTPMGSEVFIDDVESGNPSSFDNLSVVQTTEGISTLSAAGINNNGQVAGTYSPASRLADGGPGQLFLINTDGSIDRFYGFSI